MTALFYGRIASDTLIPPNGETAARLGIPRDCALPAVDRLLPLLRKAVSCAYVLAKTDILRPREGVLSLGFGEFSSRDLSRALAGCSSAYFFAVTLGFGVDRFLLSRDGIADRYIADALASSLTEAAAEGVVADILASSPGISLRPRFSPGYGDLPLSLQPGLLSALDAGRRLGISLSPSYLMTPTKSVTAIIGVSNES